MKAPGVGDIADPGARRVLNGMFHETLVSLDDEGHEFSYSIDDGPGPVSNEAVENYLGVVQLHPVTDTGQTLVIRRRRRTSGTLPPAAEMSRETS